jgi:hypothetical protein
MRRSYRYPWTEHERLNHRRDGDALKKKEEGRFISLLLSLSTGGLEAVVDT